MKRYHLVIDVEKCENCNNCFLACKDEHVGNDWPGYAAPQPSQGPGWMTVHAKERGQYPLIDVAYLPVPCMHCDDAPCIRAGKGAVTKRLDGIVLIDPVKGKGRRDLVASCPYGSIRWNEVLDLPQKCTLCAHLLDKGWQKPRCVQSCPTGALTFLTLDGHDMETLVTEGQWETYRAGAQTKPTVFYKSLHRYTHCFVAGSVATTIDDTEECVTGAQVTLLDGRDGLVGTTRTDGFGDFTFEGLVPNSGRYTLHIVHENRKVSLVVDLGESVNAGVIYV